MIALLDDLPMVRFVDGSTAPFQRDWLQRSLVTAARKAGYPQWWLAEHVAASVTEFLRTQREDSVLTVEALDRSVRQVLQVIGYAEVGRQFEVGRPMVKISLVELAQAAGTGYELAFFDLLGRRLDEVVRNEGGCFELFGLLRCVRMLRGRKTWSRDCDTLRDEIVSFTRDHTGVATDRAEVQFSLL
jgi:hypothetical protein